MKDEFTSVLKLLKLFPDKTGTEKKAVINCFVLRLYNASIPHQKNFVVI